MKEQFQKYMGIRPNVVTIPVGSLEELKYPDRDRIKHSLITASRLAIRTSFAEMIGMNCNPDARRFRILHDYLPEIRRPGLEELKYPDRDRIKHSLITASRLAGEKHIDWLIEAVVEARRTIKDLTLDIYGKASSILYCPFRCIKVSPSCLIINSRRRSSSPPFP